MCRMQSPRIVPQQQSPRIVPQHQLQTPARARAQTAPAPSSSSSAVFTLPAPSNTATSASTTRICVYGDSMTAGFPCYEPYAKSMISTLAAAGVSAEVVGCGLCGLTAVDMARGLDSMQLQDVFGRVGPGLRKLLAEQGPFDLVVIMAGTNDVANPQLPAEEVLRSLKSLHEACWAVGTPTVALSVPESTVTGTSQFPQAKQKWHLINNTISAWAKAEQGDRSLVSPFFVNSARLVSFDQAARTRGLWDPDNLHFTAAGSREFGSKLAPIVASHLQGQTPLPESKTSVASDDRTVSANSEGSRPLTPEKTNRTMSVNRESIRQLTPERMGAVVRPFGDISADWNCSMQSRRMTLSALGADVASRPPSPPLMSQPFQLRYSPYGTVH